MLLSESRYSSLLVRVEEVSPTVVRICDAKATLFARKTYICGMQAKDSEATQGVTPQEQNAWGTTRPPRNSTKAFLVGWIFEIATAKHAREQTNPGPEQKPKILVATSSEKREKRGASYLNTSECLLP